MPINDELYETLRKHPRHITCPYVFYTTKGEKYISIQSSFRTAVERARLGYVRFHDLRHTFASHLVMSGVDLRTVQQLLGHKDIKMTMRYAHLAPDHLKAAVDKRRFSTISAQREIAQ